MEIYKLGDICEIIGGRSKYTKSYINNNYGEFAVISAKTTNNGIYGYINSYDHLKGITISKDGYIGEIFYQSKPFSITTHAFKLNLRKNNILEKYLFYLLLKNSKKIKELKTGSTRPSLSKNKLESFKIFIPIENIKEQKKIIDIIEPLEKIIDLKKTYLNNFKKFYIEIISKYMETNKNNTNFYKLNEIYSKTPEYGLQEAALSEGKYKYLRQTDLKKEVVDLKKFVNCENKFLEKGDFLLSRAGTIESYYFNSKEKVCFAGYLVRYSFDKKKLHNKYLYYWTKGKQFKQLTNIISKTGTTMPKLNPPEVGKIKINLPSLEIQKQIIDIIEHYIKFKVFLHKHWF